MSEGFLPLSIQALALNKPMPVDVWNDHGILLLAKGKQLESFEQMRKLASLRPMVRAADVAQLPDNSLLRPGARTAVSGVPMRESNDLWLDPVAAWPALYQRLLGLVYEPASHGMGFQATVEALYGQLTVAMTGREDESLFMLMQMLQSRDYRYCALNALACAAICHLGAMDLEAPLDLRRSLCCAAMTMNIGMATLQDQLSQQADPPTAEQRAVIAQHPRESHRRLALLGVSDARWLQWVQSHHATSQPPEDGLQLLIRMADRMVARISNRMSRPGQHPSLAMRETYQQSTVHEKNLAERLVRVFGLYPPGCYVKLRSQETAVVVRRGRKINRPRVLAVMNRHGELLTSPQLRDTQLPDYEVIAPVPAHGLALRLDLRRLLQRV